VCWKCCESYIKKSQGIQMKKDPKRIDSIMNRLTAVWKHHPELRLGQLILNSLNPKTDLYYMEDSLLLTELELYNAGYYDKYIQSKKQ